MRGVVGCLFPCGPGPGLPGKDNGVVVVAVVAVAVVVVVLVGWLVDVYQVPGTVVVVPGSSFRSFDNFLSS